MTQVANHIDRWATPRNLILVIISTTVIVFVMDYLIQTTVYDIYGKVTMPDTRISYTYAEIQKVFDTLGSEGLRAWLRAHSLDFLFLLGYSFSLAFGISMTIRKLDPEREHIMKLTYLPLGGGFADFIENVLIAFQIFSYPSLSEIMLMVASIITTLKWALIYLSFGLIILNLAMLFFKKVFMR